MKTFDANDVAKNDTILKMLGFVACRRVMVAVAIVVGVMVGVAVAVVAADQITQSGKARCCPWPDAPVHCKRLQRCCR